MASSPTLLFIGDSVTDCGRRTDPEGLGTGYVRMIAGSGELDGATVVNRGISGNRARDLDARWQQDVVDLAPDVVTVLVGINDTWRRYDSDDPTTAERFRDEYRRCLAATVREGRTVILMEPFVVPVTPGQAAWHPEDLDAKIAVVHELAAEFGATLVPLDAELTAIAADATAEEVAEDGVHPTPWGHDLIAGLWLKYARQAGVLA